MFERAQSENIGVILLTAVITLTITGAGAVVLSEWQADIEEGPIADIESEMTPINATLEHRGGDTLYPNETTIRLVGVEEDMKLSDPLSPGTSLTPEFDNPILDGEFELLVIHDPTETVVHSETYDFESTVDRLVFEIDNKSGTAYVLKDEPVNYTIKEVFEFEDHKINRTVTDEAEITGPKLDDNESASTITGRKTGTVNATAEVGNESTETEVVVLENPPKLEVQTINATPKSINRANVTGELVEPNDHIAVDLSFENVTSREFNGDPTDNGDRIVSEGEYREDGGDYTFGNGWLHDNQPLENGETRVYDLNRSSTEAEFRWALRDEESTDTGQPYLYIDHGFAYGGGGRARSPRLPDGKFRIEVNRSTDGETVYITVYENLSGDSIWNKYSEKNIPSDRTVYFSPHELRGSSEPDESLRLTDVFDTRNAEEVPNGPVEPDATDPQNYSTNISGLDVDRQYAVRASAEQEISGTTIKETGDWERFSLKGPIVETEDAKPVNMSAGNVTADVDLRDARETTLYAHYISSREFNGKVDDNGDGIISGGGYHGDEKYYTHGGEWIHDHEPLENGDTRVYDFDPSSSGAQLRWGLLDEKVDDTGIPYQFPDEALETGGGIDYDEQPLPDGEFQVEVSRSDDGETVEIYLYDGLAGDSIRYRYYKDELPADSPIYFSTFEYSGSSDPDESLRLTGVFDERNTKSTTINASVTASEPQSTIISGDGIEPNRKYMIRANATRTVDGTTSTDTGRWTRFNTYQPTVETQAHSSHTAIDVTGVVTLRSAEKTDLSFKYRPSREFNGTSNDSIITHGGYQPSFNDYTHGDNWLHDNKPIESDTTRVYTYNRSTSGAESRWALRDEKLTTTDDPYNRLEHSITSGGSNYYLDRPLPDGEFRIEVSRSADGETVDIIVYEDLRSDSVEWGYTNRDVPADSPVYFSKYEYGGSSDPDESLRLTGVFDNRDLTKFAEQPAISTAGSYTESVDSLDAGRIYAVRAAIESNTNGTTITDTGETVVVRTAYP